MTEFIKYVFRYEPIRVGAAVVTSVVAIVTTAGLALPPWLVSLGVVVAAELSRSRVTPARRAAEEVAEAESAGLRVGAVKGELETLSAVAPFLSLQFLAEHTAEEE